MIIIHVLLTLLLVFNSVTDRALLITFIYFSIPFFLYMLIGDFGLLLTIPGMIINYFQWKSANGMYE